MNKQPYIVAFLWLFICSAGLILFTVGGQMSVGKLLTFEEAYEDGTQIANLDVSGMTEDAAARLLNERINQWREEAMFNYVLLEDQVRLSSEAIHFDVPSALQDAWTQGSVDLHATIDEPFIRAELMEMSSYDIEDRLDIRALGQQLSEDARSLSLSRKTYQLHEFFLPEFELREEVVAERTLAVSSAYIVDWVEALNGYVIEPQALFSLQAALLQSGITLLDSEALDIFATGLFQLFATTNFDVLERHTNLTLPAYATVGYAAAASPNSMDLKALNINHNPYELAVSYTNNQLRFSLVGLSFINDYSLVVENIEEIAPRTVVQFSARRTLGDKQMMREGSFGYAADVYQVVTSDSGEVIQKKKLASDYYPAEHRIEEWSLQEAKEEEVEDQETNNQMEGVIPMPIPPNGYYYYDPNQHAVIPGLDPNFTPNLNPSASENTQESSNDENPGENADSTDNNGNQSESETDEEAVKGEE